MYNFHISSMAFHFLCYSSFILSLVSLFLGEVVQGRAISTIKNETYHVLKNGSASYLRPQNGSLVFPGSPSNNQLADGNIIRHYAIVTWPREPDEFKHCIGTIATINVYGVAQVGADQTSSAMIWVVNSSEDPHEIIATGWQVNPALYGDHDTHFFVSWQANNRGCYNLLCEGFVPYKGSNFAPGHRIRPLSTVNGKQYEITLKISMDTKTGDWWLYSGSTDSQNDPVGHWPKSLFKTLADGPTNFQWGGQVEFYPNQKSPPMGSGLYAREGDGKAAYLNNVQLITISHDIITNPVRRYEDQTYCYQLDGYNPFYFGGPGGCTS